MCVSNKKDLHLYIRNIQIKSPLITFTEHIQEDDFDLDPMTFPLVHPSGQSVHFQPHQQWVKSKEQE